MFRILIAEDSPVVQLTLRQLLKDEPGLEVVGVASTGTEAVEMCRQLRPDLVTMDIFMPEMDGLEATRLIMKHCPTRIVIISSMVSSDSNITFEAIRAGAIEVIEKPQGVLAGRYGEVREELIRVLRETMVARTSRIPRRPSFLPSQAPAPMDFDAVAGTSERAERLSRVPQDFDASVICFGGSTGAPAVLAGILSKLPEDFPVPIVIAQHIARGFGAGMATWLNHILSLEVKVAEDDEPLVPGTVFISPDDKHVEFGFGRRIKVVEAGPGESGHVPSVDRLFISAAERFGGNSVGILFSGMGDDGANGLLAMRNGGAVTYAQNEETSVVYGMPRVAMELGAVMEALSPTEIAFVLLEMFTDN